MRAIIDTHILLWWILGPGDRISASQREFLDDPSNELIWSVVSTVEIGGLVLKGKVELNRETGEWCDDWVSKLGMHYASLEHAHAVTSARLDPIHSDPMDRMLVAQALAHDAAIVTRDRRIAAYPVRVID